MKKKLKADTILKEYWKEEEHFADLFNAFLFQGQQVIEPGDLEERDTDISTLMVNNGFAKSIDLSRDVLKIVKYSEKHGLNFALLGIENQEMVHYAMPLRVMEYDVYTYKRQYQENARNYQTGEGLTAEEYLSRMKRDDKFLPVISIVIYYGEKVWDGAKSLKDMLVIPPKWEMYVNDYEMHLVEVNRNKLPFQNQQNKDFFKICELLYDGSMDLQEKRQKVLAYTEGQQVSDSVIIAATAAAGKVIARKKEGERLMCTFFDELVKEGQMIGEEIGKEIGKEIGMKLGEEQGAARQIVELGEELGWPVNEILQRLQNKLQLSIVQASKYISIYGNTELSN